MDWNDLSNELRLKVFEYLPQQDLKSVRLVCKTSCGLATGLLFSSLRLHPSMTCIKRLQQIGAEPHLAHAVRVLDCHPFGLGENLVDSATHRLSMLECDGGKPWSSAPFDQLSQFELDRVMARLYHAYIEEIAAQRELQRLGVAQTLNETLAAFLCIRTVTWEDREELFTDYEWFHDEVEYFTDPLCARTGANSVQQQPNFTILHLCSALQTHRLTSLSTTFDWRHMQAEKHHLDAFCTVLKKVNKLHLCIGESAILPKEETFQQFRTIMQQATQVRDLSFKGGTPCSPRVLRQDWVPSLISNCAVLLGSTFSSLERISLSGAYTTEDELVEFVRSHRHTLKSVSLRALTLGANAFGIDTPTGWRNDTVLGLLWRLRKIAVLQELNLSGYLEDEFYIFSAKEGDSTCFRKRVGEFVCKRKSMPWYSLEHRSEFEISQIINDFNTEQEPVGEWIDEWEWELQMCEDSSFEVTIGAIRYSYDPDNFTDTD